MSQVVEAPVEVLASRPTTTHRSTSGPGSYRLERPDQPDELRDARPPEALRVLAGARPTKLMLQGAQRGEGRGVAAARGEGASSTSSASTPTACGPRCSRTDRAKGHRSPARRHLPRPPPVRGARRPRSACRASCGTRSPQGSPRSTGCSRLPSSTMTQRTPSTRGSSAQGSSRESSSRSPSSSERRTRSRSPSRSSAPGSVASRACASCSGHSST